MRIVKGKQRQAVKGLIYGTEGIGKTTLASKFPKPLFFDTEGGTGHLDCDRVHISDWLSLLGGVHEIARDRQGYETIVIDSADWAERLAIDHICRKADKRSIEEFGFGKGYVMAAEAVGKLLEAADQISAAGCHVLFLAHSQVKRTTPPDLDEGFDRFELKLSKHAAPLFKEWADLVLFCTFKTTLVEGQDGKTRAKGGKERVAHTERAAAWDAKNRFGLPPSIPMTIEALSKILEAPPMRIEGAADLVQKIEAAIAAEKTQAGLERIRQKISVRAADKLLSEEQTKALSDLAGRRQIEISREG